ncbi:MAG: RNA-directed DNA polymerase [Desulfobacterales bacterium]|jgi:hypothetical protein
MNRLYRLLAFGYFPKELPPIFTTRNFARHTYNHPDIEILSGKHWQRSSPYLLQQKPHYRRKLDILCPQAMLGQAFIISSNYSDISGFFTDHPGNCSRPAFNRKTKFNRAVRPYAIGKGYVQKKLELRSRFPIILKLDIKNYYRSIYTHSIPWAIHGKHYAKNHLRDKNILGNKLDRAVQKGQDGQTIGIPTGPDTSFIISEIILCRIIDALIDANQIKQDRYIRYYDDIEYGCEEEGEAHKVLGTFENALRDFELEINPEKVEMLSGPSAIEGAWLYRLRDIQKKDGIEANEITEIFSFIAEVAQRYPNDHVFRYFLRKMRTSMVSESAWEIYQRILLSLLQENRGNAREIFDQLSYYGAIGWKLNKKALKEALDRKVHHQLTRGPTSELSWAVYGYLIFNINISKELAERVFLRGDCPSKVLVTKIIFERGIPLKTFINSIIHTWEDDILNSSEWLLSYEVLVNKWHNRYARISYPDNFELFEHIHKNGISFLDTACIQKIELPHIFKKYLLKDNAEKEECELEWEDPDDNEWDDVEDEDTEDDDDEETTPY